MLIFLLYFVKRGDFDNNLDTARLHVVWAATPSYKCDMLL